jgi:hypothetical protein
MINVNLKSIRLGSVRRKFDPQLPTFQRLVSTEDKGHGFARLVAKTTTTNVDWCTFVANFEG